MIFQKDWKDKDCKSLLTFQPTETIRASDEFATEPED